MFSGKEGHKSTVNPLTQWQQYQGSQWLACLFGKLLMVQSSMGGEIPYTLKSSMLHHTTPFHSKCTDLKPLLGSTSTVLVSTVPGNPTNIFDSVHYEWDGIVLIFTSSLALGPPAPRLLPIWFGFVGVRAHVGYSGNFEMTEHSKYTFLYIKVQVWHHSPLLMKCQCFCTTLYSRFLAQIPPLTMLLPDCKLAFPAQICASCWKQVPLNLQA